MSDLKVSPNFLDLPPGLADSTRAAAWLIPVPFDATSSWHKGADLGPQAIINASAALEWFEPETRTVPAREGIRTMPSVTTPATGDPAELASAVAGVVGGVLDAGALPIVLGGEHSVTIGAVSACAERQGGLVVLQIDAHADTRETYHGSAHSHACVMARAREVADIVQVGIRSVGEEELERLDASRVVWAHEIAMAELAGESGRTAWMERVIDLVGGRPVYVTIDLDAFDSGVMPATGTPEPGGLDWWQVTGLIDRVAARSRVVGFDVVELCPRPGLHACDFLAAKLVHRVLASALASRGGGPAV